MKKLVLALCSGDVPLARAFWEYAILYGTLLALITTFVALMLLQVEGAEVVSVAILLLPTPYNILMVIAVWRSAARYDGPRHWVPISRASVVVWAVLATLA